MKFWEKINAGQVYFIAEMSANHAGSLENALAIVRAAADAGADCVKIQTYTADTMTLPCDNGYFQIHGGLWDGRTLHDLYTEAALPWEWHAPIRDEARRAGLDFLSTPFDKTAVDFLEGLGAAAYKIASFEITDLPLLKYAAAKGKPMLVSTGMATKDEVAAAVETVRGQGNDKIVLLKCTSEYPAEYADMNLLTIPDMAQSFGVPVGVSDHSLGGAAAMAAAALGARVVEKHFCVSREIESPDSVFSMEPAEFRDMVRGVNDTLEMLGGVRYGPNEKEALSLSHRRSVFAARDIRAGEVFTEENVRVIRPAAGLAPARYEEILGTVCQKDIEMGMPVKEEHISVGNRE